MHYIKQNKFLKPIFLNVKNKISTSIFQFRFLFIFSLLFKSILFTTLLDYSSSNLKSNITYSFVYLISILFIYSFGYLFSNNKQILFLLIFNLLFSILLFFDLSYFTVTGDFLSLKNILFRNTFNPGNYNIFNFKTKYLSVFIDFIILLSFTIFIKFSNKEIRNFHKFKISLLLSFILFLISYFYFDFIETSAFGNKLLCFQRSPLSTIENIGPLNYNLFHDTAALFNKSYDKLLENKTISLNLSKDSKIQTWLTENKESLKDNSYKGIAKNKNVIIIQVESLENFVINKEVNSQEITPFLNSLSKNSLYFNNIYEQNNGAHSIDCDFLINTSILPVGNRVAATQYGTNIYPNSLPRILKNEGYNSVTAHVETPGDFNWMELHKNCLGVDTLYSILDYNTSEKLGYGVSDKSSLTQFSEKLRGFKQPFLAQTYTLTSHGPFNLDKTLRKLDLPDDIDNSYLGGYFQSLNYTDEQLELFFNLLNKNNMLENSIIVLIGDHTGVHKYYNDSIQSLDYDGNWWKDYDRKIPMFIYSSNINGEVIEKHGGQVDVLPTLCYLLGIDDSKYKNTSMGRVLVNTNIDATVLKDTKTDTTLLRGNIKDYNEERHLLDAYPVGKEIIENNYFYRKKLTMDN